MPLPLARLIAAYPGTAKTVIGLAIMALGWATVPALIHAYGHVAFVLIIAALFAIGFWLEKRYPTRDFR